MTYEEMKQQLDAYNWDDGFDLPGRIISDENCDLALALQIFYLGDGFTYFQTYAHNIGGNKEWFCFIDYLYQEIKNGNYQKTGHHYSCLLYTSQACGSLWLTTGNRRDSLIVQNRYFSPFFSTVTVHTYSAEERS